MLLRMIYDDALAQASYLVGCQDAGEAIVIDPQRDVDRYVALAEREDVRIVGAAETHVHADFLSGVRELCRREGAEALVSGMGGPEWTPTWLVEAPHRVLREGDEIRIGAVTLRVIHTPGHTPEHICFVATDGASAGETPVGLFTGDFVFVGDLGRPDLLESAVGRAGTMTPGARDLRASARRFLDLPDHLQVWPGHGAGSACGKSLGAVPQTTVGYERLTNGLLRHADEEDVFVASILSGQPEPPPYFARMKRMNVDGPPVLGDLPRPRRLGSGDLGPALTVLDTRPWAAFRAGHLPNALSAPLERSFPTIAASYLEPDHDVVIVAGEQDVEPAVRQLIRVGIDRIVGWAAPDDVAGAARETEDEVDVATARRALETEGAVMLDVRRAAEFADGHVPGAVHLPHVQLARRLDEAPRSKTILCFCRTGRRSARAASLLRRHGLDAVNVAGGIVAWKEAGFEVVQ